MADKKKNPIPKTAEEGEEEEEEGEEGEGEGEQVVSPPASDLTDATDLDPVPEEEEQSTTEEPPTLAEVATPPEEQVDPPPAVPEAQEDPDPPAVEEEPAPSEDPPAEDPPPTEDPPPAEPEPAVEEDPVEEPAPAEDPTPAEVDPDPEPKEAATEETAAEPEISLAEEPPAEDPPEAEEASLAEASVAEIPAEPEEEPPAQELKVEVLSEEPLTDEATEEKADEDPAVLETPAEAEVVEEIPPVVDEEDTQGVQDVVNAVAEGAIPTDSSISEEEQAIQGLQPSEENVEIGDTSVNLGETQSKIESSMDLRDEYSSDTPTTATAPAATNTNPSTNTGSVSRQGSTSGAAPLPPKAGKRCTMIPRDDMTLAHQVIDALSGRESLPCNECDALNDQADCCSDESIFTYMAEIILQLIESLTQRILSGPATTGNSALPSAESEPGAQDDATPTAPAAEPDADATEEPKEDPPDEIEFKIDGGETNTIEVPVDAADE